MGFVGGEIGGICRWSFLSGRFTDAEVEQFAEHIGALGRVTKPGYVVLDVAHEIALPTPLQRKRIATAVDEATRTTRSVTAHALATNSVTARGVLTAINWFVQRTFEEKVFADPRAALLWLRGFNDKLQPDAVLAEISRAVPAFARLRW